MTQAIISFKAVILLLLSFVCCCSYRVYVRMLGHLTEEERELVSAFRLWSSCCCTAFDDD